MVCPPVRSIIPFIKFCSWIISQNVLKLIRLAESIDFIDKLLIVYTYSLSGLFLEPKIYSE